MIVSFLNLKRRNWLFLLFLIILKLVKGKFAVFIIYNNSQIETGEIGCFYCL